MSSLQLVTLDGSSRSHSELLESFNLQRSKVAFVATSEQEPDAVLTVTTGGFMQMVSLGQGSYKVLLVHLGETPLEAPLRCVEFAPSLRLSTKHPSVVFALSHSNELLWGDLTDGTVRALGKFVSRPRTLCCDGDNIACGDSSGNVCLWRGTTVVSAGAESSLLWRRQCASSAIVALRIVRDVVVVATADFCVKLANVANGEPLCALLTDASVTASIAFSSPPRDELILASRSGPISFFAPSTASLGSWSLRTAFNTFPISCATHTNGFLAIGGEDGRVALYDVTAEGKESESLCCYDLGHKVILAKVTEDGYFLVCTASGDLWRWKLQDVLKASPESTSDSDPEPAPAPTQPQPTPTPSVQVSLAADQSQASALPSRSPAGAVHDQEQHSRADESATSAAQPALSHEASETVIVMDDESQDMAVDVSATRTPEVEGVEEVPCDQPRENVDAAVDLSRDDVPTPPVEPDARSTTTAMRYGDDDESVRAGAPSMVPSTVHGASTANQTIHATTLGPQSEMSLPQRSPEAMRQDRGSSVDREQSAATERTNVTVSIDGLRAGRRMDPRVARATVERAARGYEAGTSPRGNQSSYLQQELQEMGEEEYDAEKYAREHEVLAKAAEFRNAIPGQHFRRDEVVFNAVGLTAPAGKENSSMMPTPGNVSSALTNRGGALDDLMDAAALNLRRRQDASYLKDRANEGPNIRDHMCEDLLFPSETNAIFFPEAAPQLAPPQPLILPLPLSPTPPAF